MELTTQLALTKNVSRIFEIFKTSEAYIRPHFVLTGSSGSGKTHLIKTLCAKHEVDYFEVNAAQLTKEGTSGNSLSKALTPLINSAGKPIVCFVDEFDKLFISGNSNNSCAHESTTGVQNEFLKVLESDETAIFGDYGKYVSVSCKNVLFVFAGAFNGEENITLDRLRDLGIKTEFLGRVGLIFNTEKLTLDDMYFILENSALLERYLNLFEDVQREDIVPIFKDYIRENYEKNTLGARMVNTLVHQYFINGGFEKQKVEQVTFQRKLSLSMTTATEKA